MTNGERITSFLDTHQPEMIRLLEKLVLIQSGTHNKKGVDRVAALIRETMGTAGFQCEQVKEETLGDHIIARSPGFDEEQKQILITGHMDTVFPENTDFNFFRQDDLHCYGPGVADMKGGLVVGIFALKAVLDAFGPDITDKLPPITFFFNSDEEVGSPGSGELIRQEARKSKMAFVFEAGGLNNEVVTGRKGNISATLKVKGQAGHAAFAGKDKASAILEMAHKTIAIEKLNDPDKGISANVGTVDGGIGSNTIPEHARARLDFRYINTEDFSGLESRIKSACSTTAVPGTETSLEIRSGRPAMPQTQGNTDLYDRLYSVAEELGMQIRSELRQGVSDANLIADEGTPVIDGLGPVGAKDHSDKEYIVTDSLLARAKLFAHLIASFIE